MSFPKAIEDHVVVFDSDGEVAGEQVRGANRFLDGEEIEVVGSGAIFDADAVHFARGLIDENFERFDVGKVELVRKIFL